MQSNTEADDSETVRVNCTNCGNFTHVHPRHELAFQDGNDGVCEDCAENREVGRLDRPVTEKGRINNMMKGEAREAKREKRQAQRPA